MWVDFLQIVYKRININWLKYSCGMNKCFWIHTQSMCKKRENLYHKSRKFFLKISATNVLFLLPPYQWLIKFDFPTNVPSTWLCCLVKHRNILLRAWLKNTDEYYFIFQEAENNFGLKQLLHLTLYYIV